MLRRGGRVGAGVENCESLTDSFGAGMEGDMSDETYPVATLPVDHIEWCIKVVYYEELHDNYPDILKRKSAIEQLIREALPDGGNPLDDNVRVSVDQCIAFARSKRPMTGTEPTLQERPRLYCVGTTDGKHLFLKDDCCIICYTYRCGCTREMVVREGHRCNQMTGQQDQLQVCECGGPLVDCVKCGTPASACADPDLADALLCGDCAHESLMKRAMS